MKQKKMNKFIEIMLHLGAESDQAISGKEREGIRKRAEGIYKEHLEELGLPITEAERTFPDYEEVEKAANKNADRFYMLGDEVSWYATQHGFQDGVEWLKNELTKTRE